MITGYTAVQTAKIRMLAEFQQTLSIYTVCLDWKGQEINNPWTDPTGRTAFSDEGMLKYYGAKWIGKWFAEARKYLDEKSEEPF